MKALRQLGRARDAAQERLRQRQQARWKASGHVHASVELPLGSRLTERVRIGEGTTFAAPPTFSGIGAASNGRHTAVGEGLYVITTNHDVGRLNMHYRVAAALDLPKPEVEPPETTIGSACWIGTNVTVLAGAQIGDGCVIGAGSVVTGTIPPFSIAVGVPCRPLRSRFPEDVVAALVEVRWWDWSLAQMRAARELFEIDLAAADGETVRRLAAPAAR